MKKKVEGVLALTKQLHVGSNLYETLGRLERQEWRRPDEEEGGEEAQVAQHGEGDRPPDLVNELEGKQKQIF